jgi:phosphatidylglycerophosphate synthase
MDIANELPWDQRLAGIVVRPLSNTAIHPNHLTALSLCFGLGAALTFALGGVAWAGWGAGLYMLAVFTDHTDGELARLTGKTSQFGHVFDFVVGGVNYTCLFIGLGLGLSEISGDWALALGCAAGLSNPFIVYLRMGMDQRHGKKAVKHPYFSGFELEDFIYLIGPITWFAGIYYFFIPYGLGTLGYLVWTIIEDRRWDRVPSEV